MATLQVLSIICLLNIALVYTDQERDEKLLKDIEEIGDIANVDNVLSIIETEIERLHPSSLMFNKNENEFKFDESIDCVFEMFDLTDDIQDLMPIIAKELELEYSQQTQKKLYKAIESSIYILCKPPNQDQDEQEDKQEQDGFIEWVSMENKKYRANIESIILKKMKRAFKLELTEKHKKKIPKEKYGHALYKKCLKKLKPKSIKSLYQKLRGKYPEQRGFMGMITGIFMYSCSRKYATKEAVQEFMKLLVELPDGETFFNYMANFMEPILNKSKDNEECLEETASLSYLLEKFLLTRYPDFKQYPVWNAMNGLVELGCAKKFVFEDEEGLPNMEDIPNVPDTPNEQDTVHPEL